MGQAQPITSPVESMERPLVMVLPPAHPWLALPQDQLMAIVGPSTQVLVDQQTPTEEPRPP